MDTVTLSVLLKKCLADFLLILTLLSSTRAAPRKLEDEQVLATVDGSCHDLEEQVARGISTPRLFYRR